MPPSTQLLLLACAIIASATACSEDAARARELGGDGGSSTAGHEDAGCVTKGERKQNVKACESRLPANFEQRDFYERLTLGQFSDYDAEPTLEAMAARSDVVVKGRLVSVAEGRSYQAARCDPAASLTTVLELRVLEPVVGDVQEGDLVYVEVVRATAVRASDVAGVIPCEPFLAFLVEPVRNPALPTFDDGLGIDEGDKLYQLVLPMGWVLETSAGLSFPFDTEDAAPELPYDSLERAIAAIRQGR